MKNVSSLGVIFILIGAALADSANLIPTIALIIMGCMMILGGKLCGNLDL